jgi:hypothetical protein
VQGGYLLLVAAIGCLSMKFKGGYVARYEEEGREGAVVYRVTTGRSWSSRGYERGEGVRGGREGDFICPWRRSDEETKEKGRKCRKWSFVGAAGGGGVQACLTQIICVTGSVLIAFIASRPEFSTLFILVANVSLVARWTGLCACLVFESLREKETKVGESERARERNSEAEGQRDGCDSAGSGMALS